MKPAVLAPVLAPVLALVTALSPLTALAHGEATKGHAGAAPLSVEKTRFGETGHPKRVTRTVEVHMNDEMRFAPASIPVKKGETIRFRVRNDGRLPHEMVLGTEKDLKAHAEMMRRHPGMEHDEAWIAHVPPGQTGEIVWRFTRGGEFSFACLQPGHREAGMVGKLAVR